MSCRGITEILILSVDFVFNSIQFLLNSFLTKKLFHILLNWIRFTLTTLTLITVFPTENLCVTDRKEWKSIYTYFVLIKSRGSLWAQTTIPKVEKIVTAFEYTETLRGVLSTVLTSDHRSSLTCFLKMDRRPFNARWENLFCTVHWGKSFNKEVFF